MKFTDLLINQKIIVQLILGEQIIEFPTEVIKKDKEAVYVSSYKHNGTELQLNITGATGVICNIFTDDPLTGKRISWRNVELTTINKNGIFYCIRTYGFSNESKNDERRYNERTIIQIPGKVIDANNDEDVDVVVRDISGVGISFYAPKSFSPRTQQVTVLFTDSIDEKKYNIRVDCAVLRTNNEGDQILVGCRLVGENRDYQIYRFIKYLKSKN